MFYNFYSYFFLLFISINKVRMKFGEYYKKQIINDWKFFYVNYDQLKKEISKNDVNLYNLVIDIEIYKLNRFVEIMGDYEEEKIYNFLIMNYMALFKSIKKFDKQLCQNLKIDFFYRIEKENFFKYYLQLERPYKKTKTIIFDKDGTLINHEKIFGPWVIKLVKNLEIINTTKIYEKLGYNPENNSFSFNSIVARGTNDDIRNFLYKFLLEEKNFKDRKQVVEFVKKKWISNEIHTKNILACGNLTKLFEYLKQKNINIAICTSDDRKQTSETIKILKINRFIDYYICGNDETSSKPSPEPIFKICEKFNVKPSECIMVGDTISDIHAGLNSKCGKIIGVLTGGYDNVSLQNADLIIESVDKIIDLFEKKLVY